MTSLSILYLPSYYLFFNFFSYLFFFFFFFNDTATTEIYTLSLHDALPISGRQRPPDQHAHVRVQNERRLHEHRGDRRGDRKSTRLNSSHSSISYAVFCLKKKKKQNKKKKMIKNKII